jgi:hypothetical protein
VSVSRVPVVYSLGPLKNLYLWFASHSWYEYISASCVALCRQKLRNGPLFCPRQSEHTIRDQRGTSSVCGGAACVLRSEGHKSEQCVPMSRPRALTAPRCMGTLEDITDVAVTMQPLCMRSRYVMTWRWPPTLRTETCYSTSHERIDFDIEYNFKLNHFFI